MPEISTLQEGRDEAAVVASAAVDGPYAGPTPALTPKPVLAGRRRRRRRLRWRRSWPGCEGLPPRRSR
jgi:hypothetical protein